MTNLQSTMQHVAVPSRPSESLSPGPVLLLGAPGVGKGTQSQVLELRYKIPQISTGDLLRKNRRDHTPLGLLADGLMSSGQLVPDALVNQMVDERLAWPDTDLGYILDGFPRTLAQAQWLDSRTTQTPTALPLLALEIQVEQTKLLRRITGRRTCSICNRIYNIYSSTSKQLDVCDDDGGKLSQRPDDTEEAFTKRMEVYAAQTLPVISYYEASGRFKRIDGDASVDQVSEAIVSALKSLRADGRV